MKPAPRVLPIVAWVLYAPLDFVARRFVKIAPVVFDADRAESWRQMVETADRIDVRADDVPVQLAPAGYIAPAPATTLGQKVAAACRAAGFALDAEQRRVLDLVFAQAPADTNGPAR